MPSNESQSPDNLNSEVSIEEVLKLISPDLTVEGLLKLISNAVRWAYKTYGRNTNPQDVEDLSQAIAILLIKDDCRVLRSFEQRSSLDAWLRVIAKHAALRFFPRQKSAESLEDQSPDDFVYQPEMELKVLIGEIKESLTPRGRRLFEFKLEGLRTKEIAKRMNIEEGSVDKATGRLRNKIRKLLESRGGVMKQPF